MTKKRSDSKAKPESSRYHNDSTAVNEPGEQLPLPTPGWQKAMLFLLRLWNGIAHYGREIAAVLLLFAFTPVTVLALLDWTNGWLVDAWSNALRSWLGWGAWLIPLTAMAVGAGMVAPVFRKRLVVHWARVIVAEVAVVFGLGLLQLFYQQFRGLDLNQTIADVAGGAAGGIVGWSLVSLLSEWIGALTGVVLAFGFLTCLAYAAGITPERLFHWLAQWQASLRGERWEEETVSTTVVTAPVNRPDANRTIKLENRPREKIKYAKRFTVEPSKESKPAKPKKRDARLPPLDMLDDPGLGKISEADINRSAAIIERTLAEFGIPAKVIDFKTGPAVTQFAVEPGYVEKAGPDGLPKKFKVRVSQISTLANDLALALSASTIRIEAPVPGHSYVGIEVPNRKTSNVGLRGVMDSEEFAKLNSPLAVALGRDVSGAPMSADLAKMPHLLIAGTTGSGKSVCITSLISCLVMNNTPEDLRMVMIDPKMVELVRFNGLPHLYGKVEVELERILGTLRWATREMDRRYKLLEGAQARDVTNYNQKSRRGGERLPRIVILIDELADLMMMAPDETERTLVRIAQMARATGIHLVVATQRPSTDIVTGLIKANFPARISFAVASGIDSRVILDTPGAESLLGRGDMLYLSPEAGAPVRLQGCLVTDREIERVVTFWKDQHLNDEIDEEPEIAEDKKPVPKKPAAPWDEILAREAVIEDKDSQIEQAIAIVKQYGTASASLLQRKMRIGYPRAARLMDELKEMGIVGREQAGGKTREVLISKDDDPIGRRARIIGANEEEE